MPSPLLGQWDEVPVVAVIVLLWIKKFLVIFRMHLNGKKIQLVGFFMDEAKAKFCFCFIMLHAIHTHEQTERA